ALSETGGDRLYAGAEQEQIAHAGDAARRLDLADQDVALRAQGIALEPGIVGPGHAQLCHADVANGHVGIGHRRGSLGPSWPDQAEGSQPQKEAANPARSSM